MANSVFKGGLLSLLVKRCPLCGYHLSTNDEEVIYHLGICVFDDISSFKNLRTFPCRTTVGSIPNLAHFSGSDDGTSNW